MEVELIDIKKLSQDPVNARKHNTKNIDAIKGSLARFGQQKPIVVDKKMVVRAGNGQLAAAKALGWEKMLVHVSDLEEVELSAFALADNRTGELAEWDDEVLKQTLLDLHEEMDVSLFGFDPAEELTGSKEGLTDDDAVPEVEENIHGVKRGEIYQLGNHRLMCGDSTDKADVDLLMAGEKADICFTSPPYAQQRDYGEAKEQVQDWDKLMVGVFGNLPMSEEGQVFVNLGLIHRNNEWKPYWENWLDSMGAEGWRKFGWYVWDQGSGLPGDWSGRLAPSFEFIFHFNRKSKKPIKTEEKDSANKPMSSNLRSKDGKNRKPSSICKDKLKIMDSVIRQNRHLANDIARKNHPATFPIALPQKFLEAWPGNCYEPFLGSGSTLIACEKTNRKCYGMEIDPHYCSVIIERWQNFTGEKVTPYGGTKKGH